MKEPISKSSFLLAFILFAVVPALPSCQVVGPRSLIAGRPNYTDAIHQTTVEQILTNILRVRDGESTQFMDVSEVDSQLTFGAQLTGGQANIGAKSGGGASGAVSGTSTSGAVSAALQYNEQPTIRYAPLLGQALVAQITTPINAASIVKLYGSGWPILSVLTMSVDNITPRYADYYAAINAIADLDQYGAINLAAGKSELTSPKHMDGRSSANGNKPKNIMINIVSNVGWTTSAQGEESENHSDTLILFLLPERVGFPPIRGLPIGYPVYTDSRLPGSGDLCKPPTPQEEAEPSFEEAERMLAERNVLHLWIRLLQLYQGTQPPSPASTTPPKGKGDANSVKLSPPYPGDTELARLNRLVDIAGNETVLQKTVTDKLPLRIEIRTAPIDPSWGYRNQAPILRTRSALGVLKALIFQKTLEAMTPFEYQRMLQTKPNKQFSDVGNFYVLTENQVKIYNVSHNQNNILQLHATNWANTTNCYLFTQMMEPSTGEFSYQDSYKEIELASIRRFIILEVTAERPTDAYVSVAGPDGKWYSIASGDMVSKLNFSLVAQFMTMQAIASQTPPLTPTLSVGPH